MYKRIGIYAGTFDPVHAGHITFALQALFSADLDEVYFLPERQPRNKSSVEHYGHRVAMLNRALKPHPRLNVVELVESKFSVNRTLPALKRKFSKDYLVFLFGSDVITGLQDWPGANRLLKNSELIIGLRNDDDHESLKELISKCSSQPETVTIINSFAPHVSSGKVRNAIRQHQQISGLLASVERYSDSHWLYISLGAVDTQ